jgi:type II secretory pathway pseudopilin PulG
MLALLSSIRHDKAKGFTLVDVLVSALIIALAVSSITIACNYAFYQISLANHKLQALNLCEQAIENLKQENFGNSTALEANKVWRQFEWIPHDINSDPAICTIAPNAMTGTNNAALIYRAKSDGSSRSKIVPYPVTVSSYTGPSPEVCYAKILDVEVSWDEPATGRTHTQTLYYMLIAEQSVMTGDY